MVLYRLLLGIDAIAVAILFAFFVIGINDGSVSSFNIGIWAVLLGGTGLIVAGGIWFRRAGHLLPANLLLAVLSVPALLYGLFALAIAVMNPRWT